MPKLRFLQKLGPSIFTHNGVHTKQPIQLFSRLASAKLSLQGACFAKFTSRVFLFRHAHSSNVVHLHNFQVDGISFPSGERSNVTNNCCSKFCEGGQSRKSFKCRISINKNMNCTGYIKGWILCHCLDFNILDLGKKRKSVLDLDAAFSISIENLEFDVLNADGQKKHNANRSIKIQVVMDRFVSVFHTKNSNASIY